MYYKLFLFTLCALILPVDVLAAATENVEKIAGSIDLSSVENTAADVGVAAVSVGATIKSVGIIRNAINQA